MKCNDIVIRDPFILLVDDTYYMYGSYSLTVWSDEAYKFECFKSKDLENWEGPIEIFHRPEGFWADRNYWAPECISYQGKYYLITTLANATTKKGIYALRSDSPEGPFEPYSQRLTPEDWTSIDGTIYQDGERIYLVFSHSFEDVPTGDMCYVELSADLTHRISEPKVLFGAAAAPWAKPVPFAKEEFGMDGDVYFTDGPYLFHKNNRLYMSWSSWSNCGYAVGLTYSDNGKIDGNWIQLEQPIFPENGGHGMMFTDKEGNPRFTLHYPNDKYQEHPIFPDVVIPE